MKYFLPKASSILSTSISATMIFISSVAYGDTTDKYIYNPSVDLTYKRSKNRKITEFNYMQPFLGNENYLPILDLKLKLDNYKSKEINLGLVYRYNHEDRVIFGTYAYFDHRHTGNNFSVNGLTLGAEILSQYFDTRANIYLPQNKRKKIEHNHSVEIIRQGTSIFATLGGNRYESSLKGYDIEIGTPLFGFSNDLNERLGTKIYGAAYRFTGKDLKPITGNRFRIEQNLKEIWVADNSYMFHINGETQFDNVGKRQNYIGLGLKITFNDKQNSNKKKPSSMRHRMMETVIRDVDIVTSNNVEPRVRSTLYTNDKPLENIYYVGGANDNYAGIGTEESPYSFSQINEINCEKAAIVITLIDPTKGGTSTFTKQDYALVSPYALNGKQDIILYTHDANPVAKIDGRHDISISSLTNNTIIIDKNIVTTNRDSQIVNNTIEPNATKLNSTKNSSIISFLEPRLRNIISKQIEAFNIAEANQDIFRVQELGAQEAANQSASNIVMNGASNGAAVNTAAPSTVSAATSSMAALNVNTTSTSSGSVTATAATTAPVLTTPVATTTTTAQSQFAGAPIAPPFGPIISTTPTTNSGTIASTVPITTTTAATTTSSSSTAQSQFAGAPIAPPFGPIISTTPTTTSGTTTSTVPVTTTTASTSGTTAATITSSATNSNTAPITTTTAATTTSSSSTAQSQFAGAPIAPPFGPIISTTPTTTSGTTTSTVPVTTAAAATTTSRRSDTMLSQPNASSLIAGRASLRNRDSHSAHRHRSPAPRSRLFPGIPVPSPSTINAVTNRSSNATAVIAPQAAIGDDEWDNAPNPDSRGTVRAPTIIPRPQYLYDSSMQTPPSTSANIIHTNRPVDTRMLEQRLEALRAQVGYDNNESDSDDDFN